MRRTITAAAVVLFAMTALIQLGGVGPPRAPPRVRKVSLQTASRSASPTPMSRRSRASSTSIRATTRWADTSDQSDQRPRGDQCRKIIPEFAPVDPLGTAGAATACTHLTEDENVFAVMGFFQAADVACYLNAHATPIIGASLTAPQSAQAKAPSFNNIISDSDLIPKEMAIFEREGAFAGKKIGVVATSPDQAEMNLVIPALHKVKADVVQTAVNSVPDTDTVAFTQEYGVIAEKFQSSGVNTVVAVGNAGNSWAEALQDNQSAYHPRIVATDYIDLDAYVTNKLGYKQSIIKDALTAGGYPPVAVVWDDPAMQRCIATIHAAEPAATINDPVTATSSTPVTWTAPELACQQMALFSDFVKAAGKTLTNVTLAKAASSVGKVTIPGGGGLFRSPGATAMGTDRCSSTNGARRRTCSNSRPPPVRARPGGAGNRHETSVAPPPRRKRVEGELGDQKRPQRRGSRKVQVGPPHGLLHRPAPAGVQGVRQLDGQLGSKTVSGRQRSASSSREVHTPRPGRPRWRRRAQSTRARRPPTGMRLCSAWSARRRSITAAPPSARSAESGWADAAAMASVMSRTWNAMASMQARARWARPTPRIKTGDDAARPGIPPRAAEAGERGDEGDHHCRAPTRPAVRGRRPKR